MKIAKIGLFLALLIASAGAQQDGVPTVKLWKLECAGIGGWGAASQAIRVRATLEKMKGIRSVVFDTTGTGYLGMRKKAQPNEQSINKILSAMKPPVKVKKLTQVQLPKKTHKYEVTVTGVSWQASCVEIREILKKVDGVVRVHPYGANGKVIVHTTKKGVITKKVAEGLLKDQPKLKVRKFKRL